MDEATSALDRKNESEIQATLDQISEGRTTIVIAHRLSTIINSDKILVLSKGEVIQEGTHTELMKIDGKYQALQKNQIIQQLKEEEEMKIADKEKSVSQGKDNDDDKLSEVEMLKAFSKRVSQKSISHIGSSEDEKRKEQEKKEKEEKRAKELEEKYEAGSIYFRLLGLMSDYKYGLFGLFFIGLISGTMFPLFSIFFSDMIDLFSNPFQTHYKHERNKLMIEFSLLGVIFAVAKFISIVLANIYGVVMSKRIRKLMYKKMIELDIGWHDKSENVPGILTAKLSTDVLTVNKLLSDLVLIFTEALTSLITGLTISFIMCWRITLPILMLCPLIILTGTIMSKVNQNFNQKQNSAYIGFF